MILRKKQSAETIQITVIGKALRWISI